MANHHPLNGVFAAAVTPLHSNFSPALQEIPPFLGFLAQRGCHGALLLGTTGEGPSFSPSERLALLRSALEVRQEYPGFCLLAGTGTPSLGETIELTRAAFELGIDGVLVLPPYYFRKVSEDGLFAWFSQVIENSVPHGSALLGYHIPPVSGVPLSLDLLSRLRDTYPDRFVGLKDSSGDATLARQLGERFGKDLVVLNGNDRLFHLALENSASGCITALANLYSPYLRRVWDAHARGEVDGQARSCLEAARAVLDRYPPAPPLLKAVLAHRHNFPRWAVRPPLLPIDDEIEAKINLELDEVG